MTLHVRIGGKRQWVTLDSIRMRLDALVAYEDDVDQGEVVTRVWLVGMDDPLTLHGDFIAQLDALVGAKP